jgi:hypothetical protein
VLAILRRCSSPFFGIGSDQEPQEEFRGNNEISSMKYLIRFYLVDLLSLDDESEHPKVQNESKVASKQHSKANRNEPSIFWTAKIRPRAVPTTGG